MRAPCSWEIAAVPSELNYTTPFKEKFSMKLGNMASLWNPQTNLHVSTATPTVHWHLSKQLMHCLLFNQHWLLSCKTTPVCLTRYAIFKQLTTFIIDIVLFHNCLLYNFSCATQLPNTTIIQYRTQSTQCFAKIRSHQYNSSVAELVILVGVALRKLAATYSVGLTLQRS